MESKIRIILEILTDDPEIEKRLILAAEDSDLDTLKWLTGFAKHVNITSAVITPSKRRIT